MSRSEDRRSGRPDEEAFAALERAVERAVESLVRMGARVAAAEERRGELEEMLRRFTGDAGEAGRLLSRMKTLEVENAELRERLREGREGVDRILAKIRFLEGKR